MVGGDEVVTELSKSRDTLSLLETADSGMTENQMWHGRPESLVAAAPLQRFEETLTLIGAYLREGCWPSKPGYRGLRIVIGIREPQRLQNHASSTESPFVWATPLHCLASLCQDLVDHIGREIEDLILDDPLVRVHKSALGRQMLDGGCGDRCGVEAPGSRQSLL